MIIDAGLIIIMVSHDGMANNIAVVLLLSAQIIDFDLINNN